MKLPYVIGLNGAQAEAPTAVVPEFITLEQMTDNYIRFAIEQLGSRNAAAKALGITIKTTYDRVPIAGKK